MDKLFNTQASEHLATITAFLTARMADDEDAAISLLVDEEDGLDPHKVITLLLGMTDICIGLFTTLAHFVGATPEHLLQTMSQQREMFTDWSK